MKVLILEDEKPAAKKLSLALHKCKSEIRIEAVFENVAETLEWLKANPLPDLLFLDIQLNDGLSFELFKRFEIVCPVIFTTAFDEYLLKAFEYNSIDYLLKPVKEDKLQAALDKYDQLRQHFTADYKKLAEQVQNFESIARERILVKKGIDFVAVKVDEIAYFYTEHKLVFLIAKDGKRYLVDKSIGELQNELGPASFYRVNRQFLVNADAISKFKAHYKGKLEIELTPPTNLQVTVSQENASSFKKWLDR